MSANVAMLVAAGLVIVALAGIRLMNSPRTAVTGNLLLTLCVGAALVVTLVQVDSSRLALPLGALGAGLLVGLWLALRVTMIRMPQMVALLNGLGGAASALVGAVVLTTSSPSVAGRLVSAMALAIGSTTLSGSLVAAGKLHGLISQRPRTFNHYKIYAAAILFTAADMTALVAFMPDRASTIAVVLAALSLGFGIIFAIRIGGADMPVAISLLNSLSGIAAAIAGFAVADLMLVAMGAIVGAAGLILTQIMCRAMNRSLVQVLSGIKTAVAAPPPTAEETILVPVEPSSNTPVAAQSSVPENEDVRIGRILEQSQTVVIVPGYGMALAQAQQAVKELADAIESSGKQVTFAIHPVAGRMPGHMNVLLAEVDVPYEKLLDLEEANKLLPKTDLVIVVGANDVINPAAMTAVGTPIYGMPVLLAKDARNLIVCNRDREPGYAGVANPLYDCSRAVLLLGDARDTVGRLLLQLGTTKTRHVG